MTTNVRVYHILDTVIGDVTLPLYYSTSAPSNGTSGTLAGAAPIGAILLTSEPALYQNTNTVASPTWSGVATSSAVTTAINVAFASPPALGSTAPAKVTTNAFQLDTGTKTATASAGAATLNKMSGKITSEALTTAGLADYTLTLTNSDIAAVDIVLANVGNGTNTQGTIAVGSVIPGAGSVTIVVHNLHATQALNGTLVIEFAVLKN